MKVPLLIGALIIFIVGFILSINTEWAVIGILLILLSIIILLIGLFVPRKRDIREIRGREKMATSPIRKAEMAEKITEEETPKRAARRKLTRRKRI